MYKRYSRKTLKLALGAAYEGADNEDVQEVLKTSQGEIFEARTHSVRHE
jgi:hypothetical protein